jgi:excisionase family DNA binding protein
MERVYPLVYRINVAMAQLGVSRTTIYRLVNAGELELVKVGLRASGITVSSVTAFLEKNRRNTIRCV